MWIYKINWYLSGISQGDEHYLKLFDMIWYIYPKKILINLHAKHEDSQIMTLLSI